MKGFAGGEDVSLDAVLEADCDVLIPAAGGSAITEKNAGRIRAKMIAEGANAPLTPAADEILNDRGVFIIPDILCNAGGVFVSYLEYAQETQRDQMTRDEVDERLNDRMTSTFEQVYERDRQTGEFDAQRGDGHRRQPRGRRHRRPRAAAVSLMGQESGSKAPIQREGHARTPRRKKVEM